MKSVLCLGELLIDFVCTDINTKLEEGNHFIKKAGGAPANVSATIAKLGGNAYFLGRIGKDPFGSFLKSTLESYHVNTSMLQIDEEIHTTMAFVSLQNHGERDFSFNRGADIELKLDLPLNHDFGVYHFGSATALLGGSLYETYIKLMEYAKQKDLFISFDPNFRSNLWGKNIAEFKEKSLKCIRIADLVKVSEEELLLISNRKTLKEGLEFLHNEGAHLITVTRGKNGTLLSTKDDTVQIESIPVLSIDSTGAGDAFIGAFLYQISKLKNPKIALNDPHLIKQYIQFANKVGAIVCTKLGAMEALPTLEEVEQFDGS